MLKAISGVPVTIIRMALAGVVSFTLAGCISVEQRLEFLADGGIRLNSELRFPPEVEDILRAFEVRAAYLAPDATNGQGLCASLANPEVSSMVRGGEVRARQYSTPDAFVCDFTVRLGNKDYARLAERLSDKAFSIRDEGVGVTRVTFDVTRLPDMSELLSETVREQISAHAGIDERALGRDALEDITNADRRAYKALSRMLFANRGLSLVISGRRILETNGAISDDERSASFAIRFEDLVDAMLDTNSPHRQVFYAVVLH